uniref:Cilia and flagella associated protein 20 n=1 Tax=Salarias fasciatus TaxID=181472 RepID=A0A672GVK8_SALFA
KFRNEGSTPLQIWDRKVKNGHIKRVTDNDIHSNVLEVEGANVSTTYITCPVLDDKNVRRRFRASNHQSTTRVKPFICTMPMRLDDGWNQIQFNLSDLTRRASGTDYTETLRVQIHASCRIRRFKLYLSVQSQKTKQ